VNRRAFVAALFAPAIARLALAAGRQPKLLGERDLLTLDEVRMPDPEEEGWRVYVAEPNPEGVGGWRFLGTVTKVEHSVITFEPPYPVWSADSDVRIT
jgi:hypothetical protein